MMTETEDKVAAAAALAAAAAANASMTAGLLERTKATERANGNEAEKTFLTESCSRKLKSLTESTMMVRACRRSR